MDVVVVYFIAKMKLTVLLPMKRRVFVLRSIVVIAPVVVWFYIVHIRRCNVNANFTFVRMKNVILTLFVVLLAIGGCKEKCYNCHNLCKVCYEQHVDTVLKQVVCSDILSEQYFQEYIDSLTAPGLGWVCKDTAFTRSQKFCGTTSQNNGNLLNKKTQGWVCAPE